jgi:tryptophan synthase beta chain
MHGTRTYVLQNEDGQIAETHSVSAGLDYAAVGPEHALLRDQERAFYTSATDSEALEAFSTLCKMEGIIPALESSHAVAEVLKRAPKMRPDQVILVNLSGRGDKDLNTVIQEFGEDFLPKVQINFKVSLPGTRRANHETPTVNKNDKEAR